MDNGSIAGKTYPAYLAEAYEVTRLWVIPPRQKKTATTSLTLVASEDSSKAKVVGGRAGRGTGGRGAGGRGGRGLPKKRSPPPKSLKKKINSKSLKPNFSVFWLGI